MLPYETSFGTPHLQIDARTYLVGQILPLFIDAWAKNKKDSPLGDVVDLVVTIADNTLERMRNVNQNAPDRSDSTAPADHPGG